jgi:hypothetical protein
MSRASFSARDAKERLMMRIADEMIVATLDSALFNRERSLANDMRRTRRPELAGELLRDRVSC